MRSKPFYLLASILLLMSSDAALAAALSPEATSSGNVKEYVACGCGCCPDQQPTDQCLDRSKDQTLQKIIEEDKKLASNTKICALVGCATPTRYHYCD